MLLQVVLQKDKELTSYIQIPHPPQKDRPALGWAQQSELAVINQPLLDVSQPLSILTDSAYCDQTVSLSETARLKPKSTTVISQSCLSLQTCTTRTTSLHIAFSC